MSSKINWLVSQIAPGSLVLQPWLLENGISYSLTQKYTQSGWLKKLFTGVYYRPDPKKNTQPNWADALQALTEQLHLSVHLSGLSSLTYQGLSHYLPLKTESVWICVRSKQSLPKWFREFPDNNWCYSNNNKLTGLLENDFTTVFVNDIELKCSKPELAAYEIVDSIGKQMSFEHAAELFQGMVNLSPRKVQSILARSGAIQTNRIFLFLSHYHDHQWVKHLDESLIELGSGKRQVVIEGFYDKKYKITAPTSLNHKQGYK